MSFITFTFKEATLLIVCNATLKEITEYKEGDPIKIYFELTFKSESYSYEGNEKCFENLYKCCPNTMDYFMGIEPIIQRGYIEKGIFGSCGDYLQLVYADHEQNRPHIVVNLYKQEMKEMKEIKNNWWNKIINEAEKVDIFDI